MYVIDMFVRSTLRCALLKNDECDVMTQGHSTEFSFVHRKRKYSFDAAQPGLTEVTVTHERSSTFDVYLTVVILLKLTSSVATTVCFDICAL